MISMSETTTAICVRDIEMDVMVTRATGRALVYVYVRSYPTIIEDRTICRATFGGA